MAHRNELECEDVRIGNWNSRLPSDICSNREIFNEIFSIETWNKILQPDQRDRILKLLPREVSSNADTAIQTVEDLLNGTLTTFSRNPLTRFFDQLEQGQYDPEVMDMKSNIMTEWRKESLRQLKSYHAKLLEDIVVSRQKYLSRVKGRGNCSSAQNSFKNRKPDRYLQPSMQSTEVIRCKPTFKALVNTERNAVAQDHESIKLGSRKRNIIEQHSKSVGREQPPSKLSKTTSGGVPPLEHSKHIQDILQQPESQPNATNNVQSYVSSKTNELFTDSPTPFIYLLKQNESKTMVTESCSVSPQTQPVVAVTIGNSDGYQNSGSLPSILSSQTNSSPILASQLQGLSKVSSFESNSEHLEEPESGRITLNYYNKAEDKSSEDDLETSSDEFEAIEPTIGFGVSVPLSGPGVIGPSVSKEIIASRKLQIIKKPEIPPSQTALINNRALVTLGSDYFNAKTTYASSIVLVNTNGNQGQTRTTTNSNTLPFEVRPNQIVHLNSNQVETLLKVSQPQLHTDQTAQANNNEKRVTETHYFPSIELGEVPIKEQKSPSCTSDTSIKVTTSVHQPSISQPSIRFCKTDIQATNCKEVSDMKVVIGTPTTSTTQLPTYSLTNKSQGLTHSYVSAATNPSFRLTVMSPSSITPSLNMLPVSDKQVVYSPSANESEMASSMNFGHNSLNLDLSGLSNAGSGMNISLSGLGSSDSMVDPENSISMKMEIDVAEKIDDLSVLDGNPFDSIPNLSDELDGLDLDLVDGLCDFEILLSEEKKYPSFFCLIRDVLCSTKDHRMNLLCMEKTISKWCASSGAALNSWFVRVGDWNTALLTALNFLAGSYQDVHPEDFVPYIEYKYKTKYYQWIGAGRDSDTNLTPLCSVWMDNLDRLPSIKKADGETEDQDEDDEENEDSELTGEDSKKKNKRPQTPPPPRFVTDWSVRQSTGEEKSVFRKQERSRFENPHKAFTYKMHGYESVVGPVKGVYSSQVGMTNKARGHSLLVDDRPPYVTILALVRDAVARLPNGEGTRSDICEMLRDSAFLAPDASNVTLNSVVSGALDRLHYERDPCVRYDSHKKSWIYLHRDRTQDQFERLHHNRSYTKSTKCRNSGSRKPRKGISKPQAPLPTSINPPSSVTSASSVLTSTIVSASSPSNGDSDGSLANPFSSSSSAAVVSKPVVVGIGGEIKQEIQSNTLTEVLKYKLTSGKGDVMTPPIASMGSINPTVSKPLTSEIPVSLHFSNSFISPTLKGSSRQIILQTTDVPIGSAQAPNSVQIRAIRPIPVHNTPSTTCVYSSHLTNQTTHTSTANPLTQTQGQFVLGPSTMLRLANTLRMSPFRLQGATGSHSSTVRIPQHRILLTRGPVPVQSQTQGVLLGQTSCGQTVILSTTASGTINGLQAIGSISARQYTDGSHRAVYTSNATPTTIVSTASVPLNYDTQNIRLACINTSPAVTTTDFTSHSKPMTVLHTKMVGLGASTPLTNTICSPMETVSTTTTGSSTPNFNKDLNNVETYYSIGVQGGETGPKPSVNLPSAIPTSSTVVQKPVTQNHISQLHDPSCENVTGHAGQLSHSPMTSPIIIRSTHGEFVIPGHISLSRGVQGIKLVPLPMGNKTVLAKIIPNNSGPRMSMSTVTPSSNESI